MKKTLEELLSAVNAYIKEDTSDEALSLIEDIKDSFAPEGEDWKAKFEENDKAWRAKYKERFFSPVSKEPTPEDDGEDETDYENLSINDIFISKEK